MMSRTLGAPLGGTMVGGHQGFESLAFSVITPPNFGGGAGSWLPCTVVVALGEPNVPVTTCAAAGATAKVAMINSAAAFWTTAISFGTHFISVLPVCVARLRTPTSLFIINSRVRLSRPARVFTSQ